MQDNMPEGRRDALSTSRMTATKQYALDCAQANLAIAKFATDPAVYSMRVEIGAIRLLIESTVNKIDFFGDSNEASFSRDIGASQLRELCKTLTNLAKVSAKLERDCKQLLPKELVVQAAQEMVDILAEELSDLEDGKLRVERVTNRLAVVLNKKDF